MLKFSSKHESVADRSARDHSVDKFSMFEWMSVSATEQVVLVDALIINIDILVTRETSSENAGWTSYKQLD